LQTPSAPPTSDAVWAVAERGFAAPDGTRLFYRHWSPLRETPGSAPRALLLLHRGHEHSGRVAAIVADLGFTGDHAFAWDARGHGHSPGERGHAPDFATYVSDLDTFVRHLEAAHGILPENLILVANSVGAVIAATWLHDYAPRVRGIVMAAAAFEIKLYIPLALPSLAFGLKFNPALQVSSYIRSSMLTHSTVEAAAYDGDPLIARQISARVLVDLARTAKRVVHDAAAIDTPTLMLAASADHVVKLAPQRAYFDRLASSHKRFVLLPACKHAIFYESDATRRAALDACRSFIDECWDRPPAEPERFRHADATSASATMYRALQDGSAVGPRSTAYFAAQRALLGVIGPLSDGMRIGLTQGFDSGASLDHVYRNQARGRLGVGALIDRGYLDAIGWRGIRLRRTHLQETVAGLIDAVPRDRAIRILDIAAGGGRYLLETVKRFGDRDIAVTLRDRDANNLGAARALARTLGLDDRVTTEARDAFDPSSYAAADGVFDIVIVSGLYELFPENALVLQSLSGIARLLRHDGALVYTGQPWHPQLALIAGTLRNHRGVPWVMRPRPQAELDGLVSLVGLRKASTKIGLEGIFTVSVARRVPAVGSTLSTP
jgi:alpha-beta hydrolase superfamily lysophospholipase/SAM-dependent methyltransferase